jgi:hypothetical protein
MSALRSSAALLAALVLVPSLAAQISDKQAVAEVKTTSKAQIKAFKQNGAAALGTLDAALKSAEAQLGPASDLSTVTTQVGTAAITFVSTMNTDYANAIDLTASAAMQALVALANGGNLTGLYPKDLYFGTGGVLDAHRKSMAAAALKLRDAARKRLAKTQALAEKQAGLGLIVEVDLPTVADAHTVNQDDNFGFGERSRFDVVVSASKLDTAHDGVLIIAGSTDNTDDGVSVGFDGPNGSTNSVDATADVSTGRFLALFTGEPEGGYGVWAKQGTNEAFDAVGEIGIR